VWQLEFSAHQCYVTDENREKALRIIERADEDC